MELPYFCLKQWEILMLKNLLIYRMTLLNIIVIAALIAAATQGWTQLVFTSDHSHVTYGIATLFSIGLIGCYTRSFKVATALNNLKNGGEVDRADIDKMPIKNAYLSTILNSLTGLGIMGTVIGMYIMSHNVDLASANAAQTLLSNLGVAFMCTLMGIATTVWLEFNVRILDTATALLVKDANA